MQLITTAIMETMQLDQQGARLLQHKEILLLLAATLKVGLA